ncbi:MAG: NosD domain-containing protein [Candidatus Woesearchaeota archaeon]
MKDKIAVWIMMFSVLASCASASMIPISTVAVDGTGYGLQTNKKVNDNKIMLTTPTDDLVINSDTTLATDTYSIDDTGNDGVIIINSSNIVLDCNGAEIMGSGSGYGIMANGDHDLKYWGRPRELSWNKYDINRSFLRGMNDDFDSNITVGPGGDYKRITDAVETSNPSSENITVITVDSGIYNESFELKEYQHLLCLGDVIIANDSSSPVTTASNTRIEGCRIIGGSIAIRGLSLKGANITLRDITAIGGVDGATLPADVSLTNLYAVNSTFSGGKYRGDGIGLLGNTKGAYFEGCDFLASTEKFDGSPAGFVAGNQKNNFRIAVENCFFNTTSRRSLSNVEVEGLMSIEPSEYGYFGVIDSEFYAYTNETSVGDVRLITVNPKTEFEVINTRMDIDSPKTTGIYHFYGTGGKVWNNSVNTTRLSEVITFEDFSGSIDRLVKNPSPVLDNISGFISSIGFLDNITVKNCNVGGFESGMNLTALSNLKLRDNEVHNNDGIGVIFGNYNSTIRGNKVYHNDKGGIVGVGIGSEIKDNEVYGCSAGISVAGIGNRTIQNSISHNKAHNNERTGITVAGFYNRIFSNNASANGKDGLSLSFANRTQCYDNIADNNSRGGIAIIEGSENNVSNNTMKGNRFGFGMQGLFGEGPSSGNLISKNNIIDSEEAGIGLHDKMIWNIGKHLAIHMFGDDVEIVRHKVKRNIFFSNHINNTGVYGFHVYGKAVSDNEIYSNDFYGNGVMDSDNHNIYCVDGVGNDYHGNATGPEC